MSSCFGECRSKRESEGEGERYFGIHINSDEMERQCCPVELSAMKEMFYVHIAQYGSHWVHMTIENLICGSDN
jgi:hypothetical protein